MGEKEPDHIQVCHANDVDTFEVQESRTMSDVVEKTLASIPKFFSQNLLGSAVGGPQSPKRQNHGPFQSFLNQMAKSQTKSQEDRVVKQEMSQIQQKLSQPDTSKKQICECLFKLIYCSMLGYDVSFGYIHSVKLAQQGTSFEKKMGYISTALLLDEDHDLILLLINTIQKDLQSSNILDNCIALTAVCCLVDSEMVPSVLPSVREKLSHPRELVRVKATCCLERIVTKVPSLLPHLQDDLWKAVCDKDISVVSVAVGIYLPLIQENPEKYDKLFDVLLNILQQIISGKLPNSFEYHNIPMPWLQIKILKALAIFGKNSERQSQAMYPILKIILEKTNRREKIAHAILLECIITVTTIYPHAELLKETASDVQKFVSSPKYILKYTGVKALTHLLRASPEAALQCQMIIVELLDDPYPAIQRKTIDLLYSMANPSNVQVICERLLDHLKREDNKFVQEEVVRKILDLADRFYSSGQWYFDVILRMLVTCRTGVPDGIVNIVISMIQKGLESGRENDQGNREYRQHLVKRAIGSLFKDDCSEEMIQICVWVLGELATFLKNMPEDKVASLIKKHFDKCTIGVSTKMWILSALLKLYCAKVIKSEILRSNFCSSREEESFLLKQKMQELERLCDISASHAQSLERKNGSSIDQMDFTLSHLDEYVVASLEGGSAPYKHKMWRLPQGTSDVPELFSGIDQGNTPCSSDTSSLPGKKTETTASSDSLSLGSLTKKGSGLNLAGVRRVWGKEGREDDDGSVDATKDEQSHNDVELQNKRKLAAALFNGIAQRKEGTEQIQSPIGNLENQFDQYFLDNDSSKGSDEFSSPLLPSSDSGGWRSVHSSRTKESPLNTSEDPGTSYPKVNVSSMDSDPGSCLNFEPIFGSGSYYSEIQGNSENSYSFHKRFDESDLNEQMLTENTLQDVKSQSDSDLMAEYLKLGENTSR